MSPLIVITDRVQITVADVREIFSHAAWTERRTPAQILTIGRRLIAALEQQMRGLGLERAELTTQQLDFWKRLGYEENARTTYLRERLQGPVPGRHGR